MLGYFINDRLQERQLKINSELDVLHDYSDWSDEMEQREIELNKEYDELCEIWRRWDSMYFTEDDHQEMIMNAYTR